MHHISREFKHFNKKCFNYYYLNNKTNYIYNKKIKISTVFNSNSGNLNCLLITEKIILIAKP